MNDCQRPQEATGEACSRRAAHLDCCCLLMGALLRCCTVACSLPLPNNHCLEPAFKLHLAWLMRCLSREGVAALQWGRAACRSATAGRAAAWRESNIAK